MADLTSTQQEESSPDRDIMSRLTDWRTRHSQHSTPELITSDMENSLNCLSSAFNALDRSARPKEVFIQTDKVPPM